MTRPRALELLAFFAIYVIWGSTYLAIKYAVESIPPLLTAGVRHLVAGAILYAIAVRVQGQRVRLTGSEWRASVVVAALFFLIGHGSLHWAEQTVPSGIAALLIATEPLWIALLMPAAGNSHATLRTAGGLAAGLAGVALLIPREALSSGSQQLWASGAVLIGAMSWALGVRYASTATLPRDSLVRAASTLLCGAALLLAASFAAGEFGRVDVRAITGRSVLGLAYLILFGSVVAFSAYVWLLDRRPATLVATHTFVNPVVAVLLGWLAAGEPLTPAVMGATGLIVAAVFLLRSDTPPRSADRPHSANADTANAASGNALPAGSRRH